MLNIIRMDLHRFIRSKSLYIITAACMAITAFMMYALNFSIDNAAELGITPLHSIDEFASEFFIGNFLIVFIIIFAVIFMNAEYKYGFNKNIYSLTDNKFKFVLSKIIMVTLFTVILYAASLLVVVISCWITGDLRFNNPKGFAALIGIGILAHVSIVSITVAIFNLARHSTVPMIIGMLYVLMGNMLFNLINFLVGRVFHVSDFMISKYTSLGNITLHLSDVSSIATNVRCIIVAIIMLIVGMLIGTLALEKKDVK